MRRNAASLQLEKGVYCRVGTIPARAAVIDRRGTRLIYRRLRDAVTLTRPTDSKGFQMCRPRYFYALRDSAIDICLFIQYNFLV